MSNTILIDFQRFQSKCLRQIAHAPWFESYKTPTPEKVLCLVINCDLTLNTLGFYPNQPTYILSTYWTNIQRLKYLK